jgi:hypothetical protein
MTVTLRQETAPGAITKGSALSFQELDNNFIDLLNASRITVRGNTGSEETLGNPDSNEIFSVLGTGGISSTVSSNSAGEITVTFAPSGLLSNVIEDTTPQLGGNLDVEGFGITTTTTNQDLSLSANGTGKITIDGGEGIDLKAANTITTSTAATDLILDATGTVSFSTGITEAVYVSTTTSGTYAPAAADGSIHYVALDGDMTINGFTNFNVGQSISLLMDNSIDSAGGYNLTLGADFLTPGGNTIALTPGGFDLITLTCVDPFTPLYIAVAINNLQ